MTQTATEQSDGSLAIKCEGCGETIPTNVHKGGSGGDPHALSTTACACGTPNTWSPP